MRLSLRRAPRGKRGVVSPRGTSGDIFDDDGFHIGFWWIEGPEGATGQSLVAEPSVEVISPISGIPVGRLTAVFTAGDTPGRYVTHFGSGVTAPRMIVDVTE